MSLTTIVTKSMGKNLEVDYEREKNEFLRVVDSGDYEAALRYLEKTGLGQEESYRIIGEIFVELVQDRNKTNKARVYFSTLNENTRKRIANSREYGSWLRALRFRSI